MNRHIQHARGVTVMLVLVFMGVFVLITGAVTSYVFVQAKAGRAQLAREQSFQIAETGLEYYRWFLAHNPDDLTNGTGLPGPYPHEVSDPEGGELGAASISINGNSACGVVQSVDITSEGTSNADVRFKRTLAARYARPSVAEFAFIINSNVWAGADRVISGPYHSNGGIRMDGTSNSTVTSSVENWLCTSSFGCSPSETKAGIFGSGIDSTLWSFPVPQIDFAGIAVDLAEIKTIAEERGLYFQGVSGRSERHGYHMIFLGDGTIDVYRVLNTVYAWGIHIDDIEAGWQRDYHTINNESYLGNYVIPPDCGLIFVEDMLWLEGEVSGKVTIASADLLGGNFDTDIILNGNITYSGNEGEDGLTAIAERSVLVPLQVPDDMSLRGIYVAQNGYFGRNLYACWYAPHDKRNSLSMQGTIVSNERVGTKWGYSVSGCGTNWSGFDTRTNSYDRILATDPPPFTPNSSDNSKFILWRED